MSMHIRLSIITGILFFAGFFIRQIIKNKMNIKYTLIWFFMLFIMIFAVIFDNYVLKISNLIGFKSPVNFILTFFILFCLLVLVSVTAILSHMNSRIYELVQEVALLDKKVKDMNKSGTRK